MARAIPNKRRRTSVPVQVSTFRYQFIGLLFATMFVSIVARAGYLQVVDTQYLQSQGDERYLRTHNTIPTRGMVVDRHDKPLAISTPVTSIWVHPKTILAQQKEYSYSKLTALLGINRDELLKRCRANKTRQFLYIKRQMSPQLADQILSLGVPGVNSQREYKRYYPAGPVFGHVLGFANIDNEGQEGLELAYNKVMKGRPGKARVLQDNAGHVVEYVEQLSPVKHGDEVKLSIDSRIQYLAYRYLQAAVKRHRASSASLVALDAKTGEILAMVNQPDFNPNNRAQLKSSNFRNRAFTDLFEPGSTVKPFTVGMALDEGVVRPDTLIDTEKGAFFVGRSRISDTKDHGEITVSEVIKKSSNIGAAKIALMMQPRDLYGTYHKLGFGETNKLKLQGEQKGILSLRKRPIEHATMSYGYGLSVNTLQLARAYVALANDGVLLPVSLHPVDGVPKGQRVFSAKTARQLQQMMESVVTGGTAIKAQVPQYRVAGKTGTTHRLENGHYQDDSYISLFAGFAPVSDPDMVMVVIVNDPKGDEYYGGSVAGPVFSKVMSGALRFRNVAPDAIEKPEFELMITRPQTEVVNKIPASGDIDG